MVSSLESLLFCSVDLTLMMISKKISRVRGFFNIYSVNSLTNSESFSAVAVFAKVNTNPTMFSI